MTGRSMCGGMSPENAGAITSSSSRPITPARTIGSPSHQVATLGSFSSCPSTRRRQRRQEAQHGAGLDHAGAERVRHHHIAVADRLHETRNAEPRAGAQLQRIGEIGIEAAQQHLGALQARHGADEHAVVADGEVLALDQQEAEIAGEIGVLEIGFVQRPGRQHADRRIVAAAQARQLGLERLEERRDALDPKLAVDVRHGARQREPVLQRKARAGRRLGAVAEHPPAAVRRAADVDAVKAQMRSAGRLDADQRAKKFRIAGDQRRPAAGPRGRDWPVRRCRPGSLRAARRAESGRP